MRSPLSSAHQGGFGVTSGAALQGRPRRYRNSGIPSGSFPMRGATMDVDFVRGEAYAQGKGRMGISEALSIIKPNGTNYRTSPAGVLVPTPNNLLDYDPITGECLGILIEEASQNLTLDGSDISTANWTQANTTRGAKVLAPDGTVSAVPVSNGPPGGSYMLGTMAQTLPSTAVWYSRSVFAQAVTGTGVIALESFNGTGFSVGVFDLLAGTGSAGGSDIVKMIKYPNGWWRCIHMFLTSGAASPNMRVIYVGAYGGTTVPTTVNLWGHMAEQKVKYATSYTPDTRGACLVTMPMADWINQQRGTAYAEFRGGLENNQSDYGRVMSQASSWVLLSRTANLNGSVASWFGGNELSVYPGWDCATRFTKAASSWEMQGTNADRWIAAGGVLNQELGLSAPANATPWTSMGVGSNSIGTTNMLNGHLKRMAVLPYPLAPDVLRTITR